MVKHAPKGRKGWDDTVREMAKQAQVPRVEPTARKRETRQRRAAATRHKLVTSASSDAEVAELRAAVMMDCLLETNYYEKEQQAAEDDDEYRDDEEEDAKRSRTTKKPRSATSSGTQKSAKEIARERRLRPKNVAQILLDEFLGKDWDPNEPDWISAMGGPSRYPPPKVCVITGRPAPYTDPVTGCPYADAEAFAVLRENPPPWVKLAHQGAPYYEAIKQIKAERAAKLKRMQQEAAAAAPAPATLPKAESSE